MMRFSVDYTNDRQRQLAKLSDSSGNRVVYHRNEHAQLVKISCNGQDRLCYSYDKFGRISTIVCKGEVTTESFYQYDAFNRLVQMEHWQTKGSGESERLARYDITYDNDSRIISIITDLALLSEKRHSEEEHFKYNALGGLIEASRKGDDIVMQRRTFEVDAFNNITSAREYNGHGSLIETTTFSYDTTNPIKLLSMTRSKDNRSIKLEYSANGHVVKEIHYVGDKIEKTINYRYNAKDQWIGITGNDGRSTRFGVDGEGRIISWSQDGGTSSRLIYYANGFRYCEVRDKKAWINFERHQLISISHDDQSLSWDSKSGASGGIRQRLYDPLGNVVLYLESGIDTCWSVYRYTPSGEQECLQGKQSDLGYQGNETEPESGSVIYGHGVRPYRPELRRFLMFDKGYSPFGSGRENGYAYASNDPINHHDPSGH
ncbi:MAG: RHS repeat-associated core domain-containing protein, partial [Candidatus Thiodiazotropha sp.]